MIQIPKSEIAKLIDKNGFHVKKEGVFVYVVPVNILRDKLKEFEK